ncbi:hypothetical protein RhiirB3_455049 [Rhizophagus irregularis]|nr:hypothetical protein RhiirB3_455049 [Rhizophagus irregularis]
MWPFSKNLRRINLLRTVHPTNFLYDRQVIDKLSGFRNCTDYDYPIKLTELSFVPYPIVIGKWFFAKSTGINKVAIQQGETITSSFSYSGKTSIKKLDFCSVFRCPFVAGNFNETFEVDGTDQMKLMCIEGPLAINFP